VDVFLVRHAKAGDRQKWEGPDRLRPVSKKGRRQADALVDLFGDGGVARILSSPYVRCVQTVQPLADHLGLKIEETDALAEGASAPEVVRLAREAAGEDGGVVLCTHGDVIPTLLDTLALTDGLALPEGYPCAKGSTWRLRADGHRRFVAADYLTAPS
jgi:8-oxo-dGTP diphosphatase